MHRSWTCSPNEELEKWVGGCTFFFSCLSARLAQDFWILFRTFRGLRGRERALRGVATPTVPPNSIHCASSECRLAPAARNSVAAKLLQTTAVCRAPARELPLST